MTTPWTIFELIATCIDYMFLLLVPTFQLRGLRNRIRKWHVVVFIVFFSILITIYSLSTTHSISSMYIAMITVVIYVVFFNEGRAVEKVFWIVFPILLLYIVELATMYIMIDIHSITADAFTKQNEHRFFMVLFPRLLELFLTFISTRYKLEINKRNGIIILPSFLSLLFLPIFELLGKHVWQLSLMFLVNIVCFVFYALYINKKHNTEQMKLKLKNTKESVALREYLYEFQGDVNASLQMIWGLAKLHELPEIERYMRQFSNINTCFAELYDTGNQFLDAVLSLKDAYARKRDINIDTNIKPPLEKSIDYTDVGNILIHLIDNAIEAVDRIAYNKHTDRTIIVDMYKQKKEYVIMVKNPTNGASVSPLPVLLSRKNMGLGLKAVHELTDKHNGSLEINHENNTFTTVVRIPVQKIERSDKYVRKNSAGNNRIFNPKWSSFC